MRPVLRPNEEVVLVHSDKLRAHDPAFTAAIDDATNRLGDVPYVENITSPFDQGGSVTDDGHSALVKFEIAGDSTEATDRVDPTIAAVNDVGAANPDVEVSQFGTASAAVAIGDTISGELGTAGKLSLPVTLIILIMPSRAATAPSSKPTEEGTNRARRHRGPQGPAAHRVRRVRAGEAHRRRASSTPTG